MKKNIIKFLINFFTLPNLLLGISTNNLEELTIEELEDIIVQLNNKKIKHILDYQNYLNYYEYDPTTTINLWYEIKISEIKDIIEKKKNNKIIILKKSN